MHNTFRIWFTFLADNRKSETCPRHTQAGSESCRRIQNPKWLGIFAIALTFAFGGALAEAQQTGKIFRIGYLDPSTASGSAVLLDVFRHELSKLGWIEGKNITIEYRLAEGKMIACLSLRRIWFDLRSI